MSRQSNTVEMISRPTAYLHIKDRQCDRVTEATVQHVRDVAVTWIVVTFQIPANPEFIEQYIVYGVHGVKYAVPTRQSLSDTFTQKSDPSSFGYEVHIRVFTSRYQ
jgi:hypothetical protein